MRQLMARPEKPRRSIGFLVEEWPRYRVGRRPRRDTAGKVCTLHPGPEGESETAIVEFQALGRVEVTGTFLQTIRTNKNASPKKVDSNI
jgi:hypothetical protein